MRGTQASGWTSSQPASCSAATPLPMSTTDRMAIRIELKEKNLPIGRRLL